MDFLNAYLLYALHVSHKLLSLHSLFSHTNSTFGFRAILFDAFSKGIQVFSVSCQPARSSQSQYIIMCKERETNYKPVSAVIIGPFWQFVLSHCLVPYHTTG